MKTTKQEATMNALTLKSLLLSVITEVKFGHPLTVNAKYVKAEFKALVGLKKSAPNIEVLKEMRRVYKENNLLEDFNGLLKKFKVDHLITTLELI